MKKNRSNNEHNLLNISDELCLNPNLVGGKSSALAKLIQNKFRVPNGFCIPASFTESFFKNNNSIIQKIRNEVESVDFENIEYLDFQLPQNLISSLNLISL